MNHPARSSRGGPIYPTLHLRRVGHGNWVVNLDDKADVKRHVLLLAKLGSRRQLWAAQVYRPMKKSGKTTLASLDHIRNRIEAADVDDISRLHYLIYMVPSGDYEQMKRQLLAFDGFSFDESNRAAYRPRLKFLHGLTIPQKQMLGFILGVCPLNERICEMDIIELILFFLMCPHVITT